jgi:hypothetical protein
LSSYSAIISKKVQGAIIGGVAEVLALEQEL